MAAHCNLFPIEEQILPTEEYELLSAAVTVAERPFPVALSAYLSLPPYTIASRDGIVVTLRPRPRFPPSLQKDLEKHALNKEIAPHEPLYIPLEKFEDVRNLCNAFALPLQIPPTLIVLARQVIDARRHALAKHISADDIGARVGFLWHQLLPFQRLGVIRAVSELGGRVLIADGMGLGKTLTALAVVEYYRREPVNSSHLNTARTQCEQTISPVLILCPAILRAAWATAVLKWLPGTDPTSVHVISNSRQFFQLKSSRQKAQRDLWDTSSRISFVICSYDLLPKIQCQHDPASKTNDTLHFPIVVVDECHNLRSITTARTKATMPFLSAANYKVLISGTPATSRPAELYSILSALLQFPNCPFLCCEQFLDRYCGGLVGFSQTLTNEDELNVLLSSVMVRREKSEVLNCLPPKIRRQVILEISSSNLHQIAEVREDLNAIDEEMKSQQTTDERYSALKCRREGIQAALFRRTADVKIAGVITRMKQLLGNGGPSKFIVFAHHLHLLDCLQTFLETENITLVRIDGSTECAKRSESVTSFQNIAEVRVALLSFSAAGVGLTLTAADLVLFAELSWVPSVLVQAEDRAHRIGRINSVTIEYVIAPGTLDDLMWSAVQGKLNVLNKVIDGSLKRRREAFDVANQSGKKICLSELDAKGAISDAVTAMGMSQIQPTVCSADESFSQKQTNTKGVETQSEQVQTLFTLQVEEE